MSFATSQLPKILLSINEMFSDARQFRDTIEPVEAFRSIAENQTFQIDPILKNESCRALEVTWLTSCDMEATDCSAEEASGSCVIGGDEIASAAKEYKVEKCLYQDFTVWDDDCKGKFSFEDKAAEAMGKAMQVLRKGLNARAVAFLAANLQANNYTTGQGTVQGDLTYIDPALWTPDLIAELSLHAQLNDILEPIFLTGTNLWNARFNANYNNLNVDQKDQLAKFNHFSNWYWDPKTVDVTLASKSTIMFDRASVGFLNKINFDNAAPINQNDPNNTHVFHVNDPLLVYMDGGTPSPLRYEVITQRKCKTDAGSIQRFGTSFRLNARYEFITSPYGCNGESGVLQFVNAEAPDGE
jgi:hypothetical protein